MTTNKQGVRDLNGSKLAQAAPPKVMGVATAIVLESRDNVAEDLQAGQKIEPFLFHFEFTHLPPHLKAMSRLFAALAITVVGTAPPSAERKVALRKLLESKDAAVRSMRPGCP